MEKQKQIHLEIGDWVCERGISQRLSPPMYVVGIWKDVIYLEIDPEQGDPFEVDIKDIEPMSISRKIIDDNGLAGLFSVYAHKGDIAVIFKNADKGSNQHIPIKYVHELQHFMRLHGIDKEIRL